MKDCKFCGRRIPSGKYTPKYCPECLRLREVQRGLAAPDRSEPETSTSGDPDEGKWGSAHSKGM